MKSKEAISKLNKFRNNYYNDIDEEKREIAQALNVVLPQFEELKRYPTADEVCLEIMKHYRGKIVFYNEMARTFNEVHITKNEETVSFYANGEVGINYNGLPPHLITLIGRFYEGLEKVGKEDV